MTESPDPEERKDKSRRRKRSHNASAAALSCACVLTVITLGIGLVMLPTRQEPGTKHNIRAAQRALDHDDDKASFSENPHYRALQAQQTGRVRVSQWCGLAS